MNQCILDNVLLQKINEILQNHEMSKYDLVGILLEIQDEIPSHYIPSDVADYVGEMLDVPLSKVYDVITFYAALSDKPRGRNVIQLCKSTCCKINKYEKVLEVLEVELGIQVGETTEDGLFTLEYSSCFGACDVSPAMRIGNEVHGNLDEKKVKELIRRYRGM